MKLSLADIPNQQGFFVPALVLTLLIVLFLAMLFGTRLLDRSRPMDVEYSARYHELNAKESLDADERAELEVERCRFERDLLNQLEQEDLPSYEHARSRYESECQYRLPL